MKPITAEWIEKAEDDFAVMQREIKVQVAPAYDAVCFHAQQCAEKYLKACLCQADAQFGKIHDLVALLEYALDIEPDWEKYREDLAYLSDFSVSFRYPGESADHNSALEAVWRCEKFRNAARKSLGLEIS
ncbi:MAG: HEPN domain-containing protein [Sedimentisphaerales bacterium]|nr:HEPN domain-containing protein [Sedimentisphaerales bacterium]